MTAALALECIKGKYLYIAKQDAAMGTQLFLTEEKAMYHTT